MPSLFLLLFLLPTLALAQETEKPPADAKPAAKQFVYVLRLVPRLHDNAAWTEEDEKIVGEHFRHLQQKTKDGVVILAGRTDEPGKDTFGIVIFEAESEDTARAFMESDPAVKAGIMTARLHPFRVALQR